MTIPTTNPNTTTEGGWMPISTAPNDSRAIRVRTADGYELEACWAGGFLNDLEEDCGGWVAIHDGEYPDDWTDGVCWNVNEDERPSDPPIVWREIA